MPHFYFHISGGPTILEDKAGEELANVAAAMSLAQRIAADLAKNESPALIAGLAIRVTDDTGEEVYRAPLTP